MDADNAVALAPHRQAAREAVAEALKGPAAIIQYTRVVQQLTMVYQRHGLGQALAFMQLRGSGKPGSPYQMLGRQMDRWLLTTLAVSARTALAAISTRDSGFYREASEHAWLFIRALREGLEENR